MNAENEGPKIHIDSDWKAEAQQEKERLAKEEEATADKQAAGAGKPTFFNLVEMIAMQAVFALSGMQGPGGENIPANPEAARAYIDLLDVLEQKTSGNLTDDEKKALGTTLHELRLAYVNTVRGGAAQPPPSVQP